MKQTFAIKFYCKECNKRKDGTAPVIVSLSVNGERLQWSLPKKCKPKDFEKDQDMQIYCTSVRARLNKIYTKLDAEEEAITAFKIKDIYINGCEHRQSYTIKKLFEDGLNLKKIEDRDLATYRKYQLVADRFCPRTGLSENMEADRVTLIDILTFEAKARQEHSSVTVMKELRQLKYYFRLAFESGKISKNPFAGYKIKTAEEEQVYLEYDELKKIMDCRITDDRLDKIRDIFLFLCFTGLEWADLVNLKPIDVIINAHGQRFIQKPRVKTGVEYVSILYGNAAEIWHLYKGNLPLVSLQKFNLYLKELMEVVGINKEVSSLTARHSYACFLLNTMGLSEEVVSKMLGHTSTKQTRHYAKMSAGTVFNANIKPGFKKDENKMNERTQKDERTKIFDLRRILELNV